MCLRLPKSILFHIIAGAAWPRAGRTQQRSERGRLLGVLLPSFEGDEVAHLFAEHAFVLLPAQIVVAQHLASYQQFPPRQRPGSFSIEQVMEKLRNPPSSN